MRNCNEKNDQYRKKGVTWTAGISEKIYCHVEFQFSVGGRMLVGVHATLHIRCAKNV